MAGRNMSTDAMISEIGGKLEMLIASNKDASESRRRTHEKIDALGQEVHSLRAGFKDLSDRVTEIEPTWKDYLNKQAQVRGAGRLGMSIWWIGGGVLATAVALYNACGWVLQHFTFRP
jgi:hypothetical protein